MAKMKTVSDARLRISSRILLYLNEFTANKKTSSGEITRVQHLVYQHYIDQLSAVGPEVFKKNQTLINHLKR